MHSLYLVSNEAELRDALASASSNPGPDTIVFTSDFGSVTLGPSSLEYTGDDPLYIYGRGATLYQPDNSIDVFNSSGGGLVNITSLSISGGYRGIHVCVPADAEGTTALYLTDVEVSGSFYHGVHIDDKTNGSDASVALVLEGCTIEDNGAIGTIGDPNSSSSDSDGIRVDEGGIGYAAVDIDNSFIVRNGADGIQIDESGEGDAYLYAYDSDFVNNGFFDPDDYDDGIDIDEAGDGSIGSYLFMVSISGNYDEGLDLNEEDAGDARVLLSESFVAINADKGIKITEEGVGDILTGLKGVLAAANGDDGVELEQFDGTCSSNLLKNRHDW